MPTAVLLLLALQAIPVGPQPEAGRWVFRESRAPTMSNAAGISATLLAEDGVARLAVRCDLSFGRVISIQFLPSSSAGLRFSDGIRLERPSDAGAAAATFDLVWESNVRGAFARDDDEDGTVSAAVREIRRVPGRLRVAFTDGNGIPSEARFASRRGMEALDRVLQICPWRPRQPEA